MLLTYMRARLGLSNEEGQSWFSNDEGQTLVEYALIIALVSITAVLALGFLSGKINQLFSDAGNAL